MTSMKYDVKVVLKGVFSIFLPIVVMFNPLSTLSMQGSMNKEEIVYGILQPIGTCEAIYVVNHFPGTPPFIDYGTYEWVRNLTNTTPLSVQSSTIEIPCQDSDFFYEGKTKNNMLPWDFSFAYEINGKPTPSSDLGGSEGELKITITIEPGLYENTFFYEKYALQPIVTLHSDQCENIHAPGATIISTGKEKKLMYTVLPGSHWTSTITADVSNFSMKPIMIHGMQLTVPIDIDQFPITTDISKFQDSIHDLQQGSALLSSGATDLTQGARRVSKASHTIHTNTQDFTVGIDLLADGINEMQNKVGLMQNHFLDLNDGSSQILESLQLLDDQLQSLTLEVNELELLLNASSEIQDGIKELSEETKKLANCIQYSYYREQIRKQGLDIEDLKQTNTEAITQIEEQIVDLTDIYEELKQKPGFYDISQRIAQQIHQLKDVKLLLEGNNAVHNGTKVFFEESSSALDMLANGMKTVEYNYTVFHDNIQLLVQTLIALSDDIHDLTSGIHELATSYEEMDQAIGDVSIAFIEMSQGCFQISQGVMELLQKTKEFAAGTTVLATSSSDLLKGTLALKKGSSDLNSGIFTLSEETKDLDQQVQKQIDDAMESLTGETIYPPSFASKNNGSIQCVQFHIRTQPISAPKSVSLESKESRTKSFWEKLLDLFGL
jgi:putative membrane protein